MARIALFDGHPDPDRGHFVHALADAYAEGAAGAGHELRRITVADLDFPLLRVPGEWQEGALPPALAPAAEALLWAEHLVFLYPLWLGDLPALFKGFLEQLARPGIAFGPLDKGKARKRLTGKSARIVVTMGMPGFWYRLVYRAHSLKSFERNILKFVGVGPVASTVIGMVEGTAEHRAEALGKMRGFGADAA